MYDDDLERDLLSVGSSILPFGGLSFLGESFRRPEAGVDAGELRSRTEGGADASELYGDPGMGVRGCPRSNASGPLCEPELCCAWSELFRVCRFPEPPFRDGEVGLGGVFCVRPGELRVDDCDRRDCRGLPLARPFAAPSLSLTYERERRYGARSAPDDFDPVFPSIKRDALLVIDSRRARAVF